MRFIIVALALMAMFSTASGADQEHQLRFTNKMCRDQQFLMDVSTSTSDPQECANLAKANSACGVFIELRSDTTTCRCTKHGKPCENPTLDRPNTKIYTLAPATVSPPGLPKQPRICTTVIGTFVVHEDGTLELHKDPQWRHYGYSSPGYQFTEPKMQNPSGDKYVGLTCCYKAPRVCLLTESGKMRCHWNEKGTIPTWELGDVAPVTGGKYVFLDLTHLQNGNALAALRDDGVVELWGNAVASMGTSRHPDPGDYPRGLYTPPAGRRVVFINVEYNWFMALLDDGTVIRRHANGGSTQYMPALMGMSKSLNVQVTQGIMCSLRFDQAWVCEGHRSPYVFLQEAPAGRKFVADKYINAGKEHLCGILDNGDASCFVTAISGQLPRYEDDYAPKHWVSKYGEKFIQCSGGEKKTCCMTENGKIECIGKEEAISMTVKLKGEPCTANAIAAITKKCECGSAGECASGKFCYDDACNNASKYSACPVHFHDKLTVECLCGAGATTSCAVGQWCYGGSCQTSQRCNVRSEANKKVFYGAKVYGSWNQTTRRMMMNLTAPWTVEMNSINWTGTTDLTMQYLQRSKGLWKKDETDPCSPTYVLDVAQTTFFGAGSKFRITGSQLTSSLKVGATEHLEVTKNQQVYEYDRKITNTVPVLVNLVTKTTINVRFKSTVVREEVDFVLFIGAEDNFADATPNVIISMQVHSRTCVDHTPADTGVRVKTGADNIKVGSLQKFEWEKYTNGTVKRTFQHNLCVEELKWTFVPKGYKENTYEIELEFDLVNLPNKKFTTIAAIDIKQADVLADVGFDTTMSTYDDENCTSAKGTFVLGQKFYAKIEVNNLVVNTTNITCNTFIIKQTKNGNVFQTDLKAEVKYGFMQKKHSTNKHICGAELESHHFHVSIDGYDTVLEAEIELTYDQTNTVRRLLAIPLNGNEMSYDDEIMEVSVGSMFDETDRAFRETKRAPDTDDMVCEMEIEENLAKQTAVGGDAELSTDMIPTLMLAVLFITAVGFSFGYMQNKGKEYKAIPENEATLLVEME